MRPRPSLHQDRSPRPTRRRVLATALGATAAAVGGRRAVASQPPRPLGEAVTAAQERSGLPGMAAAVFSADETIELGAAGVRRAGAPGRVTSADAFHLGSTTKAMTATMIATLVEDGSLSWASRPAEVFPEWADRVHPGYAEVSLAQVLAHRAGLPGWETPPELPDLPGVGAEQRRAAAEALLTAEPAGPAGTFRYSNAGYGLAAAMAERATGRAWPVLMTERLFDPLGVAPTYGWPRGDDQPRGHQRTGDRFVPVDPVGPYQIPAAIEPAGDLSLPVADYVRFGALHLRGLAGRSRFLRPATFAAMHRPTGDYALGWIVTDLLGQRISAHEGSAGTFYAVVALVPDLQLGAFAVANAGDEAAGNAVRDLTIAALSSYLPR